MDALAHGWQVKLQMKNSSILNMFAVMDLLSVMSGISHFLDIDYFFQFSRVRCLRFQPMVHVHKTHSILEISLLLIVTADTVWSGSTYFLAWPTVW